MSDLQEDDLQAQIDREVAEGQVVYDQLIAEGHTKEQIRDWWLANSGVAPEDWPHDHDEGD